MLTILALFLFTIIYEALIVAYTISVADRKKYWSAFFSATIEPIKCISLLIVIDSAHKILGIAAISIACAISNVGLMTILEKLNLRKKKTKIYQ